MEWGIYRECSMEQLFHIRSLFTFSLRRFPVGYHFRGESHDFFEAVLIMDGRAGVTADKDTYELSAGQMILHPPGEFHNIWSADESLPEVLVFSFCANAAPTLPVPRVFSVLPRQMTEMRQLQRDFGTAFQTDGVHVTGIKEGREWSAAQLLRQMELFLLTLWNAPQEGKRPSKRSETYYHICSTMEENTHRALSLDELALLCHISVPTLEKTVKAYAGFGAMTHYNSIKMRRAGELLLQGASVKQAALAIGFSDPNYFSVRFHKWAGLSPTNYARQQKKKQ